MRLPCALLVAAVGCLLGGCGDAVRVIDRSTGEPVAGASVTLSDAHDRTLLATRTSGRGLASLGAPPAEAILTISAPGYRTWGATAAEAGSTVALEPLWLDAFLDHGRATVGQDAPGATFTTPRPCPCNQAR